MSKIILMNRIKFHYMCTSQKTQKSLEINTTLVLYNNDFYNKPVY